MDAHSSGTRRRFHDRAEAGRHLAGLLEQYAERDDVIVCALPRGGVPVAFEVARHLSAPLDVFVVRKLGVPGHEELALGAIASGDVVVRNEDVVQALRVSEEQIARVTRAEGQEVDRREQAYRDGRPAIDVAGKTVLLVDDGAATGATMRAAVRALRARVPQPARVVVALPTAPSSTRAELQQEADEVVCATTPVPFVAVGQSYREFGQTSDVEVRRLLQRSAGP